MYYGLFPWRVDLRFLGVRAWVFWEFEFLKLTLSENTDLKTFGWENPPYNLKPNPKKLKQIVIF